MNSNQFISDIDESLSWQWNDRLRSWRRLNTDPGGLASLFQGLAYGYGHYTSFVWPVAETDWECHWQRLSHDSRYLGLSVSMELKNRFYEALAALPDVEQRRFRLSHVPLVTRFQQLVSQPEIEAAWLLTAQCNQQPETILPVSLKTVPYARRHASVKHFQIADTVFEKRCLAQNSNNNNGVTDILFTRRERQTVFLLEAGFANLLLLKEKERLAVSPDPNLYECLPGVAIRRVMGELFAAGWQVQWGRIAMDDLASDCRLFLTNTIQGVVPVKALYQEISQKPLWECGTIKTYQDVLALL